jgi:phage/plasmid-associated DNA primase
VGSAILKWAVRGYLEWQVRRLDPPEGGRVATTEYRRKMARIGKHPEAEFCHKARGGSGAGSKPVSFAIRANATGGEFAPFNLSNFLF